MNFNISSAISSASIYLPGLCHLDPSSTTLTDDAKLQVLAILALNTISLTTLLCFAVNDRKNLKHVSVLLCCSTVAIAALVSLYIELNSIPFGNIDSAESNFTNSTANVHSRQ